jgi:hypothetical protein
LFPFIVFFLFSFLYKEALMAVINAVNEILHHIRVKLAYIARTDNEASLSIEDVCAALKNRGGFTGNYNDLVKYVKQFFDEAAYQFCDGFAVNTGYFSVHPNVDGTFDKITEGHDTKKHPVTFRFRTCAPLRRLAEHMVVEVEGLADVTGYINEVTDITAESVNDTLTSGGMFSIAGEDPDTDVYFVPADGAEAAVKVTGHLGENTASKVLWVIPALGAGKWKAEIRTQYNGSSSSTLKSPRTIASTLTLSVPAPAP